MGPGSWVAPYAVFDPSVQSHCRKVAHLESIRGGWAHEISLARPLPPTLGSAFQRLRAAHDEWRLRRGGQDRYWSARDLRDGLRHGMRNRSLDGRDPVHGDDRVPRSHRRPIGLSRVRFLHQRYRPLSRVPLLRLPLSDGKRHVVRGCFRDLGVHQRRDGMFPHLEQRLLSDTGGRGRWHGRHTRHRRHCRHHRSGCWFGLWLRQDVRVDVRRRTRLHPALRLLNDF
jgi:hypothetical protein